MPLSWCSRIWQWDIQVTGEDQGFEGEKMQSAYVANSLCFLVISCRVASVRE
jgi:hypothetical protein